ncbi:MAG: N-acetyltransferase family protein [Pseudomonadota bacterium]
MSVIRPATQPDAPAIAALWNAMIRETLATFTTEEKLFSDIEQMIAQRTEAFWVAEHEGGVVGFITYGPFRGGPGYAHTRELSIVLSAEAQGQGIGRALMTCAVAAATARGIRTLIAAISSANPGAIAFHTALGFTKSGHLTEVGFKRGQWLDLILMQKRLTPTG